MNKDEQTMIILQSLIFAYPDADRPGQTLHAYLRHLSDIPGGLLEAAVHKHIQTSPFFPRISDLRALAKQLANAIDFNAVSPAWDETFSLYPSSELVKRAIALEDDFYQQGKLDEAAWLTLIQDFRNANRRHRARRVAARYAIFRAETRNTVS